MAKDPVEIEDIAGPAVEEEGAKTRFPEPTRTAQATVPLPADQAPLPHAAEHACPSCGGDGWIICHLPDTPGRVACPVCRADRYPQEVVESVGPTQKYAVGTFRIEEDNGTPVLLFSRNPEPRPNASVGEEAAPVTPPVVRKPIAIREAAQAKEQNTETLTPN